MRAIPHKISVLASAGAAALTVTAVALAVGHAGTATQPMNTAASVASGQESVAIPTFVQTNYNRVGSGKTDSATFSKPNTAGNLLVVYVIWSNTTSVTITDSRGNSYTSTAAAAKFDGGRSSAQVFYAKNITAGANTVTATFATSVSSFGLLYVQEYAGLDRNSPLDVTTSATGVSGSAMSSGSIGTTNAGDLLVGAGASSASVTQPGSGYTIRSTGSGNVIEDRVVTTTGSYSASATHNGTYWVMQLAAFKADPGVADTAPPAVPTNVSASAASASQINLSWTASTDNVGVTGYMVFRGGTQIGTTSLPSSTRTPGFTEAPATATRSAPTTPRAMVRPSRSRSALRLRRWLTPHLRPRQPTSQAWPSPPPRSICRGRLPRTMSA